MTKADNHCSGDEFDERFTFATFVVGQSNRFAHTGAVSAAEAPGRAFNPLLIWGGHGLGKSHLLHAVGQFARERSPGIRARYVLASALDGAEVEALSKSVDLLLVDDVHQLDTALSTAFGHQVEALHNANKQIVLTADRPPDRMGGIGSAVSAVSERGLIVDVVPPDSDTRIAILRKKAERDGTAMPDEVIEHVVRAIDERTDNASQAASIVAAEAILTATALHFGLDADALRGTDHGAGTAEARRIATYLCRTITGLTMSEIARIVGRGNAYVQHSHLLVSRAVQQPGEILDAVQAITRSLRKQPEAD